MPDRSQRFGWFLYSQFEQWRRISKCKEGVVDRDLGDFWLNAVHSVINLEFMD